MASMPNDVPERFNKYEVVRLKRSVAGLFIPALARGTVMTAVDAAPPTYEVEFIDDAGGALGTRTVCGTDLEPSSWEQYVKPPVPVVPALTRRIISASGRAVAAFIIAGIVSCGAFTYAVRNSSDGQAGMGAAFGGFYVACLSALITFILSFRRGRFRS